MVASDNNMTGRLAPNSMLANRYLINHLAGQGGMGAVYEAIDTKRIPQRRVAIKEMSQSKLPSKEEVERARKRFRGEAAMLRSLDHPNLPRVYESFEEDGRSYLVMEFVEGQSLLQRLQAVYPDPLPTAEVLGYAAQLCDVLDYLHRQYPPIIFRDLKPANIMVMPNGHVMLIDFGIARFFKQGQQHDTEAFASRAYASPQQLDGKQTNVRSDLYSLGATLHHCLTGKTPAYAASRYLYPSICDFNSHIPPKLDQAIRRLVEFDEESRPPSAKAFMHEMIQALSEERVFARDASIRIPPTRVAPAGMLRLPGDASGTPPDQDTFSANRPQADSEPLPGWMTDLAKGSKRVVAGILPTVLAVGANLGSIVKNPRNSLDIIQGGLESIGLAIRGWSSRVLTPWFITLLLARLALLVVASFYMLQLFHGSYTVVAFCLALVALLITIASSISSRIHEPIARTILFCTGLALFLVCFALQATPDVQSVLHHATFSQLIMVILLLGGLITLLRTSNRLTWVDYVTLIGIAATCTLLQYTLGAQELRQIPLLTLNTYQPIVVSLTALLAFIAFIALCRLGSSFSGFDRGMVLLVAAIYAFLQFTVGYQELAHLPMFAPGVSMSRATFLNVAYVYLLLVFVPLGVAFLAFFFGHRFAYINRLAIFLLAAACAILQYTLANTVEITVPYLYPGSYIATRPLAQVIANSFTFNQLFTYGGLLIAGLFLLIRLFRPIDWLNRPAILFAAIVGTLLQSAFWTDEMYHVQFPSNSSQLSGFNLVTIIAANQLVAGVLLVFVIIAVGLTVSIDVVRLVRQITWVNDSAAKVERSFIWVNGIIKVVDRLLIIGLTLVATLLLFFFTPPDSFLAQPINPWIGLVAPTIALNQVVALLPALCTIVALCRIGGKFNRWDCLTLLLNVSIYALIAWGSAAIQRITPPVFTNLQQFIASLTQEPSATILLIFGLAFAGAISLSWLSRTPRSIDHVLRFVLVILFAGALIGTFLHLFWPPALLIALILMLMGLFVAIQMERVR